MTLVLHQARYDLLSFARNREARFFTIVLPLKLSPASRCEEPSAAIGTVIREDQA